MEPLLGSYKNTKKQGDAGLGIAIGWFASRSYTVCVPLTDSQDYDLVVDRGDGLMLRVQVKTTTFKAPSGAWVISLTIKGGNRTGKGKIRAFDKSKVDAVFVVAGDGSKYYIPVSKMKSSSTIYLGEFYKPYLV